MGSKQPTHVHLHYLGSSIDWDDWFFIIQRKAEQGNIPQLVNIQAEEEPRQLVKPDKSIPATIKKNATFFAELDQHQRQAIMLLKIYEIELAEFLQKQSAQNEILDFIWSTVSPTYMGHVRGLVSFTLYRILQVLREQVTLTARIPKMLATLEYARLQTGPGAQSLMEWLSYWETVCMTARKLNLPEAQGMKPLDDLVKSIERRDATLSDSLRRIIEILVRIKPSSPPIFDVIQIFRDEVRYRELCIR